MSLKSEKWGKLIDYISNQFGSEEQLNLQAILFLIGVNELGQGYRNFKKSEKVDLLHIAICKILSHYGYYSFEGKDQDGWPHWKSNEQLPNLKPEEQTILLKEGVIKYFEEAKINFFNYN